MQALNVPIEGEQPQLSDVPEPKVTEGTVLIRVKAAGLNPMDNAIAAGMVTQMMQHLYPVTLGRDAAGVVEAVGEGVEHVGVGDEVFGHLLLAPPIQAGTLAEYALLPAATVAAKPTELDFVTAAALPLSGAAAAQATEAIDPQPGQTVLINGASGGVGSYAIQLLAARGATVIATGTADDIDRLTSLGAHTVVDYTAGPIVEEIKGTYPNGVDALVNLAGFTAAEVPFEAVRKGGKVSTTTGAPDGDTLSGAGLTGSAIMAMPVRETTLPLAEQAAAGELKVDVTKVLPLEQAAEGLATIASGKARGQIVVKVSD
jgi:NADPH:quinone reductase-like Zn-dependent oxidoreductase